MKTRVFRQRVRRQRAQRRDVVDDPDAAAVRGDDQVVVARMNRQVANRDVRQIAALVLRPLRAAVERNPQPEFRAEEEQVAD